MILFLCAILLLAAGGASALILHRSPRAATIAGAGGAIAGGLLGIVSALLAWLHGPYSLRLPWDVPYGSFSVEIDALSAFFLLPVFGLSAAAALYGGGYLQAYRNHKSLGPPWFFYNLLVISMALTVGARNGVLFLVVWEVMSLASFFLVTFEGEKEEVREAGWTYLIATHLGTAFLLVLFLLLGSGGSGSLDFDTFAVPDGGRAGLLFLLAIVGFGTKAGFMPFHVWLPEAHPAAPSHVSAVMSGVMIKMGIYGLLRTLTFLGPPHAWWGWLLVAIGAGSGVLGVLFALAQHDLKRLLAYHSVENIGIITLGLGTGLLGLSYGIPALAALGFAGGLLHVVNHALFKGLLFLGAGSVLHATGSREIDHQGGLLKRMPVTAVTFLIGAVAISGLPPLNGFVSEFLVYLGAFRGAASAGPAMAGAGLIAIVSLALIGGLAAACFTKAFGIVFLGEPRSEHAAHGHESPWPMRIPMIFLAASCIATGIFSPLIVIGMAPAVESLTGPAATGVLTEAVRPLTFFLISACLFAFLVVLLMVLRRKLLAGRPVQESVTWDCGYVRPQPRMQYTSSSFAQPLTNIFRSILGSRQKGSAPDGIFPREASFSSHTPDLCRRGVYAPIFQGIVRTTEKLHWVQKGWLHLYVLYIALTLILLFAWKLS